MVDIEGKRRIIMRSFRGCKASTLPTWLGNRGLATCYRPSLPQAVQELGQAATDACSISAYEDTVTGYSITGTFCLKTSDCRPIRGVATFSAGGSGRPSSKRKDPALLLGAGWEGGGEDVAVAVWWDFENCNVPLGIEVYKVGVNIVSGLRMCGFKGPVSISAYGDTLQLSRSTQEALASTGIRLHHIPSGGKDSSDRALLVDLILWTFEHPPPAHLFLISGDRDFSNALHRLRMMNYNILLACPAGTIVSPALLGAATQVWQWNSLVRGEGLLSANPSSDSRPPDGPSGGGIGARQTTQKPYSPSSLHPGSRGPDGNGPPAEVGGRSHPAVPSPTTLKRPKAVQESASPNGAASPDGTQTSRPLPSLQGLKATEDKREPPEGEKLSRSNSDSLLREVPEEMLQQFHNILISHPNGITLTDLQTYIFNDKLSIEKDFYGHKKIVPFLLSLPHLVRLERVLMKDNKSWSYLLTSTAKAVQNKQGGSNVVADKTHSKKVAIDQEAPKVLNAAQIKSDPLSKMSKLPAVGNEEQVPQSVEDPNLQPEGSERSTKEVTKLNESGSVPSFQLGKLDQSDKNTVEEKVPSPGLQSFISSLTSMFRRWRKGQVVDNNPDGNSTADKTKVGISDLGGSSLTPPWGTHLLPEDKERKKKKKGSSDIHQKKIVRSTNSVKTDDREKDSIELGRVVAEGILQKPLVDDRKQGCDGGFEEKVVCDEDTSKEQLAGQQSTILADQAQREDSKRSWKTWLLGPTQEKSSSVTGRPITDSSMSLAVYDLSDLDKVTWKELLSRPGKLTQTSTGRKSELSATTSHHAVIGHEDEAHFRGSTSSTIEGHKLNEGKSSSDYVLAEDLKDYLRSAEGTAILSKAPNLMVVFDTLRTTGPDKFRGLQSSQLADLIDQLATTEDCSNYECLTAQVVHSARPNDEGEEVGQLRTRPVGHSREIVRHQVIQSIDESSLPTELGKNGKPWFQDEESSNGSTHDEHLSNLSVEVRSLSKNSISTSQQEDQIRTEEDDIVPLRDPDSIEDSSLSGKLFPKTSCKTQNSGPSFAEFQEWFLETVKEAYKSSERTRRLGFDLSLVKPDFEREFGVRLDPQVYGFVKLQDLVASISAVRITRPRNDLCVVYLLKEGETFEIDQRGETLVNALKACRWPQMYHDCKSLVRELMLENPEGLPGSKLKPLFSSRFQYPLDHKRAGYQRMSDLLRLMPDVVSVNGKDLVPSEELLLSLKNEASGEENAIERETILKEDNVSGDTYSRSWEDANLEKVSFEPTESWGEIDTEGNGNSSPAADIIEATPDDVSGLQGEHVYSSRVHEKLPISENVTAQELVSAETNSERKTQHLQRLTFLDEIQGPSVEESLAELLSTGPQANHKGTGSTLQADGQSRLLIGETLVNVIKVKSEADEDSGDGQESPISLCNSREGHPSFPSEGEKDTCNKEGSLFVERDEDGSMDRSDEDLESRPATVSLGDSNGDLKEEHIKLASSNGQGVEPEIMSASDSLGNMDRETVGENPPSSLYNTSAAVVPASVENVADFRQTQESEVSQKVESPEGKDKTFNTINIISSSDLVEKTSSEKSNNESIIDFDEFTGHEMSDTVMKNKPFTNKNVPDEAIKVGDNAQTSPESLNEESDRGFEGLMGDDLLHMESKTSSSVARESFEETFTKANNVDDLSMSKEDSIVSGSEKPPAAVANDLTKRGTSMHAKLHEERDGSELVYDNQSPQEEECQTSAVVSNPDKDRLSTAAEATHEGHKEGHQSGCSASDRPSLKSIWKRWFS